MFHLNFSVLVQRFEREMQIKYGKERELWMNNNKQITIQQMGYNFILEEEREPFVMVLKTRKRQDIDILAKTIMNCSASLTPTELFVAKVATSHLFRALLSLL